MNKPTHLFPWHIAILVPARNEEALLARCLLSVERARAVLPAHVSSDLILVADRCTDDTLAHAQRLLSKRGLALACSHGAVGHARALAADLALSRHGGPLHRCWLANTDADCELPSNWLVDQIRLAELGVEAVAGTVNVDTFEEHPAHVAARFRETYLVHSDGTHPHVHGANLGVRADAYCEVGGWRGLSSAEDHDLWNRLKAKGFNCRSDSALEIITSGRVAGRAPNGFAGALAAHDSVTPTEVAT